MRGMTGTDIDCRQAAILLAAIDAMEGTLSLAEALLARRRAVDLAGLDREIGRLCVAVLAAPRSAAPALRLRLESLRRVHDRLAAALAPP
jgi:hypothetical protein